MLRRRPFSRLPCADFRGYPWPKSRLLAASRSLPDESRTPLCVLDRNRAKHSVGGREWVADHEFLPLGSEDYGTSTGRDSSTSETFRGEARRSDGPSWDGPTVLCPTGRVD